MSPHFTYAHMCRDEHQQIGHNDSEHEMCPLCRALARIAELEARASQPLSERVQAQLENVPYIEPGTQAVGETVTLLMDLPTAGRIGLFKFLRDAGYEPESVAVSTPPSTDAIATQEQPSTVVERAAQPADGALRQLVEDWRKAVEWHTVKGHTTYPESVADCADDLERALAAQRQEGRE